MEDLHELFGFIAACLLGIIALSGVALKFSKLGTNRKIISVGHKIASFAFVLSVAVHFLSAEDKSILLIGASAILVLLLPVTLILFKLKMAKTAVYLKLLIVPVVVLGLVAGHLLVEEKEDAKVEHSKKSHEKEHD